MWNNLLNAFIINDICIRFSQMDVKYSYNANRMDATTIHLKEGNEAWM